MGKLTFAFNRHALVFMDILLPCAKMVVNYRHVNPIDAGIVRWTKITGNKYWFWDGRRPWFNCGGPQSFWGRPVVWIIRFHWGLAVGCRSAYRGNRQQCLRIRIIYWRGSFEYAHLNTHTWRASGLRWFIWFG